jgi:hypothetical protein
VLAVAVLVPLATSEFNRANIAPPVSWAIELPVMRLRKMVMVPALERPFTPSLLFQSMVLSK